MGSSQSTQKRTKSQRSNRLSKRPRIASSVDVLKSTAYETKLNENPPTASSAFTWRNPWTGELSPGAPTEIRCDQQRRVESFPSHLLKRLGRSRTVNAGRSRSDPTDIVLPHNKQLSRSDSHTSNFQTRQPSVVRERPKRGHSFRSILQRIQGVVQESPMEEATYDDGYFSPHAQRFSLIRRKSLLTPGIATRNPDRIYRMHPSPIGQEVDGMSNYPMETLGSSRWPFNEHQYFPSDSYGPAPPVARASTPNENEYSHLGGLKLGSLRIVNGSVSPSPSDRARGYMRSRSTLGRDDESNADIKESRNNDGSPLPEQAQDATIRPAFHGITQAKLSIPEVRSLGLQKFETVDSLSNQSLSDPQATLRPAWQKRSTSMLGIPLADQGGNQEYDLPESPFSFEKTPTMVTPPKQSTFFLEPSEDEGLALSDNEDAYNKAVSTYTFNISRLEEAAMQDSISRLGRRASRPPNKADSDYGSEKFIRFLQIDRARGSGDSRISQQCHPYLFTDFGYDLARALDESSDLDFGTPQAESSPSHFPELWESKEGDSVPETQNVSRQNQWRYPVDISTICQESRATKSECRVPHKPQLNLSTMDGAGPSRYYAQLSPSKVANYESDEDCSSKDPLRMNAPRTQSASRLGGSTDARTQRRSSSTADRSVRSAPESGSSRLTFRNKDVPPLRCLFSMDNMRKKGQRISELFQPEPPRGRTRSRSIDRYSKRLIKN
ncbi:hypothetical protein VTN02DRAFT_3761 [Thermoascus thermophilus]